MAYFIQTQRLRRNARHVKKRVRDSEYMPRPSSSHHSSPLQVKERLLHEYISLFYLDTTPSLQVATQYTAYQKDDQKGARQYQTHTKPLRLGLGVVSSQFRVFPRLG